MFASYIRKHYDLMNQAPNGQVNHYFIVGQLLLISKFLDYGDELGRRQMLTLLRKYFDMFFKRTFIY
jgi:hypothetical protein